MSRKNTHKSEYSAFANNIKLLISRYEHGNKQEFAEACRCSYETVRRWCNGDNLPDGAQLLRINDIYSVSIDWLLIGVDPGEKLIQEWSPETQEACRKVKTILESDDKTTAAALHMNISAFEQAIERYDENQGLKKDVDQLKKEVKQLRQMNTLEKFTGTEPGLISYTGDKETSYMPASPDATSIQESPAEFEKKPSTK